MHIIPGIKPIHIYMHSLNLLVWVIFWNKRVLISYTKFIINNTSFVIFYKGSVVYIFKYKFFTQVIIILSNFIYCLCWYPNIGYHHKKTNNIYTIYVIYDHRRRVVFFIFFSIFHKNYLLKCWFTFMWLAWEYHWTIDRGQAHFYNNFSTAGK